MQTVDIKSVDTSFLAVAQFSGAPSSDRVVEVERNLRAALIRDGLTPLEGSLLARYNDPDSTPGFIKVQFVPAVDSLALEY